MPIAHAKWFVDDPAPHQAEWGFLVDPWSLTFLFIAFALVALATVAHWLLAGRTLPSRVTGAMPRLLPSPLTSLLTPPSRLAGAMPRLLAVGVGITLPSLAMRGWLLVPGASLAGVSGHGALLVAEALVGLWLVSGVGVRAAAGALGALCAILAVTNGPLTLLEGAYVPGIVLYLALSGGAGKAAAQRAGLARRTLAVALGIALVAGALSEKLVVPTIMLSVLHAHPSLDLLSAIGVSVGDLDVVRLMGTVELLLGLLIATGLGGRIVPLLALAPFLVTVPVFGPLELIGHLPIYAALIALATRPVAVDAVADAWPAQTRPSRGGASAMVAVGNASP